MTRSRLFAAATALLVLGGCSSPGNTTQPPTGTSTTPAATSSIPPSSTATTPALTYPSDPPAGMGPAPLWEVESKGGYSGDDTTNGKMLVVSSRGGLFSVDGSGKLTRWGMEVEDGGPVLTDTIAAFVTVKRDQGDGLTKAPDPESFVNIVDLATGAVLHTTPIAATDPERQPEMRTATGWLVADPEGINWGPEMALRGQESIPHSVGLVHPDGTVTPLEDTTRTLLCGPGGETCSMLGAPVYATDSGIVLRQFEKEDGPSIIATDTWDSTQFAPPGASPYYAYPTNAGNGRMVLTYGIDPTIKETLGYFDPLEVKFTGSISVLVDVTTGKKLATACSTDHSSPWAGRGGGALIESPNRQFVTTADTVFDTGTGTARCYPPETLITDLTIYGVGDDGTIYSDGFTIPLRGGPIAGRSQLTVRAVLTGGIAILDYNGRFYGTQLATVGMPLGANTAHTTTPLQ